MVIRQGFFLAVFFGGPTPWYLRNEAVHSNLLTEEGEVRSFTGPCIYIFGVSSEEQQAMSWYCYDSSSEKKARPKSTQKISGLGFVIRNNVIASGSHRINQVEIAVAIKRRFKHPVLAEYFRSYY
ncbi:conserved hypothetical protein [Ricinus communis]|uniref:Uncharacterized protein n=1 Tax=Ricinus communis TaxID=3988 RepID=B9SYL0_RICCO|nr:conserved hypothetical protein [Ricinus communis]